MNYKNLIAQNIANYQLLDSGDGEKLEILCGVTMIRPCPQAIWHKKYKKELWQKATSICRRTKGGGGEWKHNKKLPTPLHYSFDMHGKKLNLDLKLTAFGHCGLFFEQWALWPVFYNKVLDLKEKLGRAPKVLNLFAYTGGASIVCAAAGAQVEHVDSAKGVIKWGQENQKLSNLKRESISWQVQDAFNQVKFYQKKSISFDIIIADPPSWGHGAKKEKWLFEEQIAEFVKTLESILNPNHHLLFLSSHTHGVQAQALTNLFHLKSQISCGDLFIAHQDDERLLAAGIYTLIER